MFTIIYVKIGNFREAQSNVIISLRAMLEKTWIKKTCICKKKNLMLKPIKILKFKKKNLMLKLHM